MFNLRISCEISFRDNILIMYQSLICQLSKLEPDTQNHAPSCHGLKEHLNEIEQDIINAYIYENIFGNLSSQLRITKLYHSIVRIKKQILNRGDPDPAYAGTNLGPDGRYTCIIVMIGNIQL